ncbi:MAG: hypothetical protein LJE75_09350 [Gammaproteobacteria bacterium]|jgi:hypothetical protein|nr:hypothetical protein [Gammaproteobacteria bacterium]
MWHKVVTSATLVAVAGVALLAGWWLYDIGKVRGVIELKSLRTQQAVQEKRNRKLAKDNKVLREQLAILERSSQIDRKAAQDVKDDLGQLEMELQAAREEIEFYRGIVAPGDVQSGLRIHRFSLESGTGVGEYHYDLVLTQLKRNDRYVTGVVDWKVAGLMLGEPGELALAGITHPAVKQLKFRFRYFQELAGSITLPEGFVPEKVILEVIPDGKSKLPSVRQAFDWYASGS